MRSGRSRILAATAEAGELVVVFRVEVQQPQGCPATLASGPHRNRSDEEPPGSILIPS